VEVAKEKRRARRLTNVTFRHADLGQGTAFRDAAFDQVVNVHSLYAQAAPDRLLAEVFRVLKPGGHAVFVNHTRRLGGWSTLRGVARARGLRAALGSLLWIVPNAIFEVLRRPTGPHYWDETVFADRLGRAGFAVLETRRTFLAGASLLVRARKPSEA
jgi:SAM-dependent methyltransferase